MPTKTPAKKRTRRRSTKADDQAFYALDHILEQERILEQKHSLPFRAPHKVLTSLQQCTQCGKDIALLIFGDNAKDVSGLEAYARLMVDLINRTKLPTYVLAPSS